MGTLITEFWLIDWVAVGTSDLKFPFILQSHILCPRQQRRLHNVPCVLHSVYMANLIAIVRGNGQFLDSQFRPDQLDNDFRVEMKVVRIQIERNFLKGADRIDAVAGMEFRQIALEQTILKTSQNPVSDKFVEGHATPQGVESVH